MPHPNKAYLGDGVYIQEGSYRGEFILTTEDGISVQNTIVLDDVVIAAMIRYFNKARTEESADASD